MYSWKPERRATRAHIRHFIALALERKEWAKTMPEAWTNASKMSQDMLAEIRAKSVHQLARKYLDYTRHRAFYRTIYDGWPIDKIEYDLWKSMEAK